MKKFIILILTFVISIGLTGCGEKIPEGKTRFDLVIRLYGGADKKIRKEHYEKAIEEFNKLYPEYHVVMNDIPGGAGDYVKKLVYKLQAGETLDVVWLGGGAVPQFVDSGFLSTIPFEDWDEYDKFNQTFVDNLKLQDKHYYIPQVTEVTYMWYNKELVQAAGYDLPWQPETWEEILEVANKMADNGVEYPFWEPNYIPQVFTAATEDELYDVDTKQWILASQGLYDAFKFIEDMYQNNDNYSEKGIATVTDDRSRNKGFEYILNGTVGIYLRGSWVEENLRAENENYADIVDIAVVPNQNKDGYATVSGGTGWVIPKSTRDAKAAFDLIKILNSYESNLDYTTNVTNDITVRTDVMESSEYLNGSAYKLQSTRMLDYTNFLIADEFETVVKNMIKEKVSLVAKGEINADDAIKQLVKELEPTIGKSNIKELPYQTR